MGKKTIRVLHVDTERGWRGGQQQAAYLLEGMYSRGYQTAVACRKNSKFESYCIKKTLPYISMGMRNEFDISSAYKIARFCQKNKFQILHLHSAHALSIGLLARLFLPALKLVAVRRVDFHIRKNFFSKIKYRNKYVDKIVCISDAIKHVMIEDGIPDKKLTTIHSGVDFDRFKEIVPHDNFRQHEKLPEHHLIVGTVAAIVDHKDYPNLLKAARIVLNEHSGITFCAIGDGAARERIENLSKELKLGDRFLFKGYREDIGQFLKTFDIFVLASKLEGMGTSVLDAQSVGLPVIGCDSGGIPEIIEHEVNGILVPRQNEIALANAILKLALDDELRKSLGEKAMENRTNFGIEHTLQNNLALYRDLLSLN